MQCPNQNKLQDFLNEKLSKEELCEIESHIEQCPICQKKLDELTDNPLELSIEAPEIDDAVLVDKIKAHRKGIRRITIYGILGFMLGLFSRYYTADKFIITKAIMALPYKLAEFALGVFFSADEASTWYFNYPRPHMGMGFFPYHPILDLIAELVTPAIIAAFIALTLGHLVSDKRVFRRKHIIRFIVSGMLVISLWFGAIHVVYSHTLNQIDRLEGLDTIIIYEKEKMSTDWLFSIDRNNKGEKIYAQIMMDISNAEKISNAADFNRDAGYELWLKFKGGGQMIAYLDKAAGIFIMQNGNQYQLSEDSLELFEEIARRKIQ